MLLFSHIAGFSGFLSFWHPQSPHLCLQVEGSTCPFTPDGGFPFLAAFFIFLYFSLLMGTPIGTSLCAVGLAGTSSSGRLFGSTLFPDSSETPSHTVQPDSFSCDSSLMATP